MPGDFKVSASAYTGTVCKNTGKGNAVITILAPELTIQTVSHSTQRDSTLEVLTLAKNVDFFCGPNPTTTKDP